MDATRSAGPIRTVPVGVAVAIGAVALALLHVVWLARFRWGYLTDWDEAGYISIALRDLDALGDGPRAFVDALGHALGTQPPVVPLSALPLLAVFGRSVDVAQVTIPLYSVVLVLASYGIARRLMPARWAALAALTVGTTPGVALYSRLFHFSVPATALLAVALWALLTSERLRRTPWVLAAGVALGLMLTARTMTVSYLPGVAIGLVVPLLVDGADRPLRARNFAILWAVALGIAALWWLPVWGTVTSYLTSAGYGAEATGYGAEHSPFSLDYWTTEIQVAANLLYLPLALVLMACFAGAGVCAASRAERGARLRRWLASDALLLAAVVVEGYLALSSTVNQGTAFALPWLAPLIVLGVAAASSVPLPAARACFASLLVAVCVFNLVTTNGISERLARPELVDVPLIGHVKLLDGRDFVYSALDGRGYPVEPPPARLPAMHKDWSTMNDRLVRLIGRWADGAGREAHVVVGTGDYFINDTRIALANELVHEQRLSLALIRPPATRASYREQLSDRALNILILSDPPPRHTSAVDRAALTVAAAERGFRPLRTLRAPDGRRLQVWSRGSPQG